MTEPVSRPRRIAIFMPSLTGGGTEKMLLRLAEEFAARGHEVDLLFSRVRRGHDQATPPGFKPLRLRRAGVVEARRVAIRAAGPDWPALIRPVLLPVVSSWALRYLPALAEYLGRRRPDALLTGNSWPNLVALWARRLAGVETRVVVSERIQLSDRVSHLRRHARWRHLPGLIARFYPEAAGITAVSRGVADDLAAATRLPAERVAALPNPVVSPRLQELAAAPTPHTWLAGEGPPVILGAGRLHPQKDFPTLLRAFRKIRDRRPARLILLGEGAERPRLERLAEELGLSEDVLMPGHVDNPFAWMSRADVFVLSSRYEGLPGVLIQALACGCPSVSTDCPSGPREILDDGRVGPLAPVGDADALAEGAFRLLDAPPARETLQGSVRDYEVERATDDYLNALLGEPARGPQPAAA